MKVVRYALLTTFMPYCARQAMADKKIPCNQIKVGKRFVE